MISFIGYIIDLHGFYGILWGQLNQETKDGDVGEKIVVYQHANKQVIWLKHVA